jgi:hypothetical protein
MSEAGDVDEGKIKDQILQTISNIGRQTQKNLKDKEGTPTHSKTGGWSSVLQLQHGTKNGNAGWAKFFRQTSTESISSDVTIESSKDMRSNSWIGKFWRKKWRGTEATPELDQNDKEGVELQTQNILKNSSKGVFVDAPPLHKSFTITSASPPRLSTRKAKSETFKNKNKKSKRGFASEMISETTKSERVRQKGHLFSMGSSGKILLDAVAQLGDNIGDAIGDTLNNLLGDPEEIEKEKPNIRMGELDLLADNMLIHHDSMFREERHNWKSYHNVCSGPEMIDYLVSLPRIAEKSTTLEQKRDEACRLIINMIDANRMKVIRLHRRLPSKSQKQKLGLDIDLLGSFLASWRCHLL